MEQNAQRNGIINLLVLLVAGICLYAVGQYAHSFAARAGSIFIGLAVLVSLVSLFQMRLEDRERLEKLEFDELTKATASTGLFKTEETETFPARRSREQFEKFFIPAFTFVLFVGQFLGHFVTWHWLKTPIVAPLNQPLVAMGLIGLLALVLFLVGKYSAGLARFANLRLLRPSASYLLLGSYIGAFVLAGFVAYEIGFPTVDLFLARAFSIILVLLAIETLITLVLEIYRPRVKGKTGLPLYESRFIGALGQPEGLFKTAAQALDYQFGFKVSETWFFQFLQRAVLWLIPAQLAILLISTMFVFLEPGEEGLLERFGRPRGALGSGLNFKLPWPIDRVYRYSTGQILSFNIGFVHDEQSEQGRKSILWTVSHYKDEFNLLVASREAPEGTNSSAGGKKGPPPVNLLSVSIPVQFQITNVVDWAYNHRQPTNLLEEIGTREVVRFLVGVDLQEVMSSARFTAGEELKKRIQEAANALKLGVKIIFVGLQDVHPPVKVAPSYEAVVSARQTTNAEVLNARAFEIETNALAQASATVRTNEAVANRIRAEVDALAQAALFTNQLPAYIAAPEAYQTRAYMEMLNRHAGEVQKIVIAATNVQPLTQINLQPKAPAIYDEIISSPVKPNP